MNTPNRKHCRTNQAVVSEHYLSDHSRVYDVVIVGTTVRFGAISKEWAERLAKCLNDSIAWVES